MLISFSSYILVDITMRSLGNYINVVICKEVLKNMHELVADAPAVEIDYRHFLCISLLKSVLTFTRCRQSD